MKETVLHHIWSSEFLFSLDLNTTLGKSIRILNPGKINYNAGPDFLNAEIIIDDISWVGNVEIHVNSSNWNEHGHGTDAAYNNLILHVVFNNNVHLKEDFPILELKSFVNKDEIERLSRIHEMQKANSISDLSILSNRLVRNINFEKLALQRLKRKSFEIDQYLKETKNNWQEVFYRILSKNFGFQTNSFPFEWLARSTPLSIIRPHQLDLHHLEAMLFGQSGLLREVRDNGSYEESLWYQYERFNRKYYLKSINPSSWKFLRMRPFNFPTIRIAQMAALLNRNPSLAFDALEIRHAKEALEIFNVSASEYWNDHFSFKSKSSPCTKKMGIKTIENILINTVIPFQFAYDRKHGVKNYKEKSLSFLSLISPEKNEHTSQWQKMGMNIESALKSQALVELKSQYNI